MKIGILGTRGIPNHYGGFEQFAEFLSLALVQQGHEVVVYNSSLHPYKEKSWNGVGIVHCKDWEDKMGTAGQFIYDFNCILDARKQNFDILLQLGYTSSSIWGRMLPSKSIIVTNMDGLEWKRTKYSTKVQWFLQHAEKWAVKTSDHLVADSKGIQEYLKEKYAKDSTFIAYGSDLFDEANEAVLSNYNLSPESYHMLIARMEPENSIEMILDGYLLSESTLPFLVVGKTENAFAQYLMKKYQQQPSIQFLGGIYELDTLNNLRHFSNRYFHGHTVGGTNPSLLEAMASSAHIAANDNAFNKGVLGSDADYFNSVEEVAEILQRIPNEAVRTQMIQNNRKKIIEEYAWEKINKRYEDLFIKLAAKAE